MTSLHNLTEPIARMMIPTYEETAALPIVRQAELSVHPHPQGLRDYMRSEWFSIRKL